MASRGSIWMLSACITALILIAPVLSLDAGDGAGTGGPGAVEGPTAASGGPGGAAAGTQPGGGDGGSGTGQAGADPALVERWRDYVAARWGEAPVVEYAPPEAPSLITPRYVEGTRMAAEFNSYMGWGNGGPPSNGGATPYVAAHEEWAGLARSDTRWQDPWGPPVTGYDDRYAHGTHDVVVILINYTDSASGSPQFHDPVTHTPQWFDENVVFNDTAGANTMNTYYTEASYGLFNISGAVAYNSSSPTGWYRANGARATYASNSQALFDEAMAKADTDVDFSDYDSDSNGYIDHVIIVHAGQDGAASGDPNDIWSHRRYWWPAGTSYDGMDIQSFSVVGEHSKLGVMCHEFGHDLGLPDLYDTDASGGSAVVGNWDVMDSGLYNTVATVNKPAHPCAWNKAKLGWVKPTVINLTNNNGGVYQINESASATNDSTVYRVEMTGTNQYFLVENRNDTTGTYEEGVPQSGIIIWHIDEDMPDGGGANDKENDGPPGNSYFLCNLETPGNDGNASNYLSDRNTAAFSESKNERDFNPLSSPGTRTNAGTLTDVWIDRIEDNAEWNRTVRLLVSSDTDPPGAPSNLAAIDTPADNGGAVNLTWDRSADDGIGDDDVVSYNVYVNQTGMGSGGPYDLRESFPATGSSTYKEVLTGLADGLTHHFIVRADDGPNENATSSNEDFAIPLDNVAAPPTGLAAIDKPGDQGHKVRLDWTVSADDGSGGNDIAGYDIMMNQTGAGAGGPYVKIGGVGPGVTTYTAQGLDDGVTYHFNVTAYDEVPNRGDAIFDSAAPADNIARPPGNLTAADAPGDQGHWMNLTWNLSGDDGNGPDDIAGYEVQVNQSGAGPGGPYDVVDTVNPGTTSYDVGGLADKTTYYFRVAALDEVPNRGYSSIRSNKPLDNVVAPPTSPGASDTPGDQGVSLNVSWEMSADDGDGYPGGDVLGYNLYMNYSGTGESGPYALLGFPINASGSEYYCEVHGLLPGVKYFFKASAYDEAPNEANTSTFNGTPIDNLAPKAPTLDALDPNPLNTSVHIVMGVSERLADVHIFDGTGDMGNATADSSGAYSIEVDLSDGAHNLTARAYDRWGNGLSPPSPWQYVVVDTTPPAAVSDTPSTAELGIDRTLNGTASHDVGAHVDFDGITNHTWRIRPLVIQEGVNDPVTLYGPEVVHVFPELGNYTVNLTVTDMAGNTAFTVHDVEVRDTIPPAVDAGPPSSGNDAVLADLDGGGTVDNDPTFPGTGTFNWSYTDAFGAEVYIDEGSVNIAPLHLFDVPGNYTVTLTVTDRSGNTASDATWVLVRDGTRPVADAGPDMTVYAGEVFRLNASASRDDDPLFPGEGNFTWTIPDPSGPVTRYGLTTTWSFAELAEYVVELRVADRMGNTDDDQLRVTVIEGTPDPLTVEGVHPVAGASGVSPHAIISATFNKPVDPGSVGRGSAFVTDGNGDAVNLGFGFIDGGTTVELEPVVALEERTTYTVTLSTALTDAAGHSLEAPYTWNFTTMDVLEVAAVVPNSGARDVLPTTTISITFDAPMDPSTIASGAFTCEGGPGGSAGLGTTLTEDGYTVLLAHPELLRYNWTYTVRVNDSVRSVPGGVLDGPFSWSFTMITLDPDDPDPSLEGVDTDGDGITDLDELEHGLDPYDPHDAGADYDGDGLTNLEELENGTKWDEADSDGDGVPDLEEVLDDKDPLDPTDNTPPAPAGGDGDDERKGPFGELLDLFLQPMYCMLAILMLVGLIGAIAAAVVSKKREDRKKLEAEQEARRKRMEAMERRAVAMHGQAYYEGGYHDGGQGYDRYGGPEYDSGPHPDDPFGEGGVVLPGAAKGRRRGGRSGPGRMKGPGTGSPREDDDEIMEEPDDDELLEEPGDGEGVEGPEEGDMPDEAGGGAAAVSGLAGPPGIKDLLPSDGADEDGEADGDREAETDEELDDLMDFGGEAGLDELLDGEEDGPDLGDEEEAIVAEGEALGDLPDEEEGTEDGPGPAGEARGEGAHDGSGDGGGDGYEGDDGPAEGEVAVECPHCGASLYIPEDAGGFECPSCGAEADME